MGYLQLTLLEFDADYTFLEKLLGRIFYDGLKPSLKLMIDKVAQQQLLKDKTVRIVNKTQVKSYIYDYHYLNSRYLKKKHLFKLALKDSSKQFLEKSKIAYIFKISSILQFSRLKKGFITNQNKKKKS